jgi:hypothetical protein
MATAATDPAPRSDKATRPIGSELPWADRVRDATPAWEMPSVLAGTGASRPATETGIDADVGGVPGALTLAPATRAGVRVVVVGGAEVVKVVTGAAVVAEDGLADVEVVDTRGPGVDVVVVVGAARTRCCAEPLFDGAR